MKQGRTSGFTLIELMITVAIVGVLSSVALPQFKRYKYKTRYSEATMHLAELFRGQAGLHLRTVQAGNTEVLGGLRGVGACVCPSDNGNVIIPTGKPVIPNCNIMQTCNELEFHPSEPLYFGYTAWRGWKGWEFVNFAMEDLDDDTDIGTLVNVVGVKNGEYYRAGRLSFGDQDTIFHAVMSGYAAIPNAPSN